MICRLYFTGTLLTLLFYCCSPVEKSDNQEAPPVTTARPSDGTTEMIRLIKEATGKVNPMKISYYANSRRADAYRQVLEKTSDPKDRLKGQVYFANELLKAGKSEEAIRELEGMLEQMKALNIRSPQAYTQVYRILALAYIRLGEQNNCIDRYNPNRCIMPFEGDGVYEMQTAVRTAIGLYERILEQNSDDHESIWMLNFAYMTLGEYPEKVPARWRLDEKAFESDYQIDRFPNIAHTLGLNTLGLSGGTCVDDFNNDGFLDIFASSWGFDDQIRFFKNNGDGTFSDQTDVSGLKGLTGGLNIAHADYNNDGWLDVLVLRGAWFAGEGKIPNSLIRNNGDGTFTDVTVEAGLLSYYPTQTAAWADFNNDGWLDLFIGNESLDASSQFPCELFMSNRDGTFTDRITESGLQNIKAMTKGVSAGDANNDGWPDLYLSFLNAGNRLFLNSGIQNSEMISFADAPAKDQLGEPAVSFPCWFWDFDNDGWEDIFVASYGFSAGEGEKSAAAVVAAKNFSGEFAGGNPRLYRNNGDGTFRELSQAAGLTDGMYAMGSNFGDIDNDGFLDFYLGTGEPSYTAVVPNKMFRNNQGKTFQDVTTAAGMGHVQKGHGVGFGDFDNDGDQDIFCVIGGAYEGDVFGDAFFLNPIGNKQNWITLQLTGTTSNRAAIGARVKITVLTAAGQERYIHRTVSGGSSFGGNSLQLETGLGDATAIKSIEVSWPNRQRTVQTFTNVDARRFVLITEGQEAVKYLDRRLLTFQ